MKWMRYAFSRRHNGPDRKQVYKCMDRRDRLAIKYGLRQTLYAILVSRLNLMVELMNERRRLPEQDQDTE